MVQIFLTYTASKFVINSALFSCWQISAYFFQCKYSSEHLGEPRAKSGTPMWSVIPCFSPWFFPCFLSQFRSSLLSFPSSLPFCPDFLPSLLPSGFSLPAWISMILLWFCSWFLILFVHPYPTYLPMATRPFPCPSRTSSFSPPTLLCKPQDLTGSGGRRAICPSQ